MEFKCFTLFININVLNHTIPEVQFLTKSTAEGLRVTIKSVPNRFVQASFGRMWI